MRRAVALLDEHARPADCISARQHEWIHVSVRACARLSNDIAQLVRLDDAERALRIADRAAAGQENDSRRKPGRRRRNGPRTIRESDIAVIGIVMIGTSKCAE